MLIQWFNDIRALGQLLCILLICFFYPLGHNMAATVPNITSSTITYKTRKERTSSVHVPLFSSEKKMFCKILQPNFLYILLTRAGSHPLPPPNPSQEGSCPNPATNKGNSLRLIMIHPLELPSVSQSQNKIEISFTGNRNDWALADQRPAY